MSGFRCFPVVGSLVDASSEDTPVARVGFDVIAQKILAIQYAEHPVHRGATGAVTAVSRLVRASFVRAGGKRGLDSASDTTPLQTKRRASAAITPGSLGLLSYAPSSSASSTSGHTSGRVLPLPPARCSAMLLDQDAVVPGHSYNPPSVLQALYKRLPPEDIVRLRPGDEIIVVLPAVSRCSEEAVSVVEHYRRTFTRIIERTYRYSPPNDRPAIVQRALRDVHTFMRLDVDYLEFASVVKKYPVRERLESSIIDHRGTIQNYDQGAGFDVAVCGYSAQNTVLVQLKHVGYIEIYHRTSHEKFTRDDIYFNKNVRIEEKLTNPFVHLLSVFDGCRFSTLEVLWKYYNAVSACRSKAITVAGKKISALTPSTSEDHRDNDEDGEDDTDDSVTFREELSDDNIDLFVGIVDSFYKEGLVRTYTTFTPIDGYLVERKAICSMYDTMVEIFPFVHSVLLTAMTRQGEVNSVQRSELAGVNDNGVYPARAGDDVCLYNEEEHSEDEHERTVTSDADLLLTKKQHACLEFFLAKLRLRSQKKMQFWAMIPPLGNHSRGYSRTPPTHPLHGVGCGMTTLSSGGCMNFDS